MNGKYYGFGSLCLAFIVGGMLMFGAGCIIGAYNPSQGITKAQGGPNPFTQGENGDTQEQCIVGALSVGKDGHDVARLNRGCLIYNGQAF